MKRVITLLLAAGLLLGAAKTSSAVDIGISGLFDVTSQWSRGASDRREGNAGYNTGGGNHAVYQRFMTQIDIVASESLQGILLFEIGDTVWGESRIGAGERAGGGIGADGVSIKVQNAYIDWIIPATELHLRLGIQEVFLPGMDDSTQVFGDHVAGIVASNPFTDNVTVTAWWLRPFAENTPTHDDSLVNRQSSKLDMFGLAVPLTFDGVEVTPWGQYAVIGRDFHRDYDGATNPNHMQQLFPRWATLDDDFNASDRHGSAFWLGLTGDITLWDPFRIAWDLNYGRVDMGHGFFENERIDVKREGWISALLAEYDLDFMTPGFVFWYGSGDDSNWRDGSEMMPSLRASSNFTSFGQDGAEMNFFGSAFQSGIAGTWGIALRLTDISFIEDLSHTIQVAYYRGTNNKGMTAQNGGPMSDPWMNGLNDDGDAYTYMTKKDSAWEFNLTSVYDIYNNLQLGVDLGYIKLDLSESAWGRDIRNSEQNIWKAGIGLRYIF